MARLMTTLLVAMSFSAIAEQFYSPAANRDYPERVLWGDTHVHTSFSSSDAYPRGNTVPPTIAYQFARGETVEASNGMPVKLRRPLDFLVVADHAENMGLGYAIAAQSPALFETPEGRRLSAAIRARDANPELDEVAQELWDAYRASASESFKRSLWQQVVANAESYNEPGRFTAFAGYEWSSLGSLPGVFANLHRVVIFQDGAGIADQVTPFSSFDSPNPEQLWAFLSRYETQTGGQVMAIPHNPNNSNGEMFANTTFDGSALTRDWAALRARWEPLIEVTQLKGDSEAHPVLSPTDEFADFETWHSWAGTSMNTEGHPCCAARQESDFTDDDFAQMKRAEYARSALKRGLAIAGRIGVNPYKFGLIGSTDSHTSLSTADNDNFWGKYSNTVPSATRPTDPFVEGWGDRPQHWETAAAGYAGVWATENTRESIFAALKRKEAYATTGPRITLRFFGGWHFETQDADSPELAEIGYRTGVPMGGDLSQGPAGASPTFLIRAVKDPDGANLDRVQVIKGWRDTNGVLREKVFDVALADERRIRRNRQAKPVGSTVNVGNATYSNSIGDPELAVMWQDPDFSARESAVYYVRAIEIPTPRWPAYDAKFFNIDLPDNVAVVSQERAYSSPIWYTPE